MKGKAHAFVIVVVLIPLAIGIITGVHAVNVLVDRGDLASLSSGELAGFYVFASLSYSIQPYLVLLGITFVAVVIGFVMQQREERSTPKEHKWPRNTWQKARSSNW